MGGAERYLFLAYQDGLADTGHGLARCRGGEVNGQVGQAQDGDQGQEALLVDKLLTVVVGGVVAQYGFHKLHLESVHIEFF